MSHLPRLVVCISGSGTNLQAVLDACRAGTLAAQVVLVVTNRKHAYGLQRAAAAGIPTLYAPRKGWAEREAYDADLARQLSPYQPDLIILAGWMHIFSAAFLRHFPKQVINLHPALPDAFPGIHAIERAFAAYEQGQISVSGCMVHYAIPEVDAGPVIATATVPFHAGDTLESYADRLHAAEHRLLVQAVGQALSERQTPELVP
ncbi:MAG: phosphoribosylglycinamide formyltransferase [Chloroflexaceae bacterium]|nr:phosphoribosylglycinamide formyltransferase [Chloroflexaceae bacterium]